MVDSIAFLIFLFQSVFYKNVNNQMIDAFNFRRGISSLNEKSLKHLSFALLFLVFNKNGFLSSAEILSRRRAFSLEKLKDVVGL